MARSEVSLLEPGPRWTRRRLRMAVAAMSVMYVCGPAKGTADKPYRCICCRRTFADIEDLGVSICWDCQLGDESCKACRARGVFVNDERVGRWNLDLHEYDPEDGLGHRLARLTRLNGVMACGERIPRAHFGQGSAVVPSCDICWTDGYGA